MARAHHEGKLRKAVYWAAVVIQALLEDGLRQNGCVDGGALIISSTMVSWKVATAKSCMWSLQL